MSAILDEIAAAGLRIRADEAGRLLVSPREKLTDKIRNLIAEHRFEILRELAPTEVMQVRPKSPPRPAPDHGAECMGCAHLTIRAERHIGTRRIWWWRCDKGHALLEGRAFGERVLLAPVECSDFAQWREGKL